MVLLVFLMMACRLLAPDGAGPLETGVPTASIVPTQVTPTQLPSPSPTVSPNITPTLPPVEPTQSPEETYSVRVHPDHALYVGDLVSFEVIPPQDLDMEGKRVVIQIDEPEGDEIGTAEFGPFGIAGRIQATLTWTWDTSGLEPGNYSLLFSVQPGGPEWIEYFYLHPEDILPPPEPNAEWASIETDCCLIHYITGTEAERDMQFLADQAGEQAERVSQSMEAELTDPVVITLLPRVLGHGGFAAAEISISYLDRNYAGSMFDMVLHHELVHILDGRLGGEMRPSILVEGLAVYLSGGHFKPETLLPRAAALLHLPDRDEESELGWYLPLAPLVDGFYSAQHEIGYLQGGALVEHMVLTRGWDTFSAFYRDIQPHESGSQAQAMNQALVEHYGLTLEELEQEFLNVLSLQTVTSDLIEDVRLTVQYYDTVRRYQRLLDPSAYFRTAWLLNNEDMRQRGIVSDYVRRPMNPENVGIESLLVTANEHLIGERYAEAEEFLEYINNSLDAVAEGAPYVVPLAPIVPTHTPSLRPDGLDALIDAQ